MALERLRRPGRSRAAGRRGSSGGPRGSRAARRRSRAWPRPAGAGARRGRSRCPSRRRRRCRGRRRGPGCAAASSRAARARDRGRVGDGAAGRPCGRSRGGRRPASTSAPQSSIGSETKTGPRGGSAGEVGAAGERQRHVLGARRLVAPLHQRVRHPRRVAVGEVRLQRHLGARLLAGGDQQRRVVGLRVEDRPHRVADARRGVQVDERGAAAGLRVAVGHPDHDRLLQAEHVAEVAREVAQHRQLGRARVAEDRRHPLLAEEVESRLADGRHRRHVTSNRCRDFWTDRVAELTSLTARPIRSK